MLKAITPKQVEEKIKAESLDTSRFPDYVFDAFNEAIKNAVADGTRKIYQKKIVELILEKSNGACQRQEIFSNKWLDVEAIYQAKGWDMKYEKQPYYETEDHFFYF